MDKPEFIIAVLDGTLAASVGATLDVLDFANRSAERLGQPALRWRVAGSRRQLRLSNGMTLKADPLSSIGDGAAGVLVIRSEEHTSELQSQSNLVCRLLLEKKKKKDQQVSLCVWWMNRQSRRGRRFSISTDMDDVMSTREY